MFYSKDNNNNDILLDETLDSFQVMMQWEKPYMEALVDNLKPTGNVLEVGFGFGYSANQIQKYNIKTHTIIEKDKNVLKELKKWAKKQKHQVIIIEGLWQEKIDELGKFDSIFFDDSPNSIYLDEHGIRTYVFYNKIIQKHANVGCRMSWYVDGPTYWIVNSFTNWECKSIYIEIPDNCEYISSDNKNTKELFLPVITFTRGTVDGVTPFAISGNSSIGIIDNLT